MSTDENKYKKNWEPFNEYKDVQIAEDYDRQRFSSISGRVFDNLEKSALRRLFHDLPRDSVILDAPTGTGRLAETLLEMGFHVVGVDISQAMLTVAQRKLERFGGRFEAICSDVHDFDPTSRQFDAVLSARVLMHYPLDEQIEFLKPLVALTQGPIVFNQSILTDYHRARRVLKRLLGNQAPASFPLARPELNQLIEGAGLELVSKIRVCAPVSEAVFFKCGKRPS